jgi:hypothetical protein
MDRRPDRSQEGNPASSSNSREHTRFLRNLISQPLRRGDGRSEGGETLETKDEYLRRYIQDRIQEGNLTSQGLLALRIHENPVDRTVRAHDIHRRDIIKALSAHIELQITTLTKYTSLSDEELSDINRVWETVVQDGTRAENVRNETTDGRNRSIEHLLGSIRLFNIKIMIYRRTGRLAAPEYSANEAGNEPPILE